MSVRRLAQAPEVYDVAQLLVEARVAFADVEHVGEYDDEALGRMLALYRPDVSVTTKQWVALVKKHTPAPPDTTVEDLVDELKDKLPVLEEDRPTSKDDAERDHRINELEQTVAQLVKLLDANGTVDVATAPVD